MTVIGEAAPERQQSHALRVSCVGVAKTYGRGRRAVVAVHGATCEVTPTARIAIVGPSGSGKSTLLHLLSGLETPTAGNVDRSGAGDVGFVFQSPSLIPTLTVAENVSLPLALAGTRRAECGDRVAQALEAVEAHDWGDKFPGELSGGQAQRVAVARVLASRPAMIVADEPTGQLDHSTGGKVIDALIAAADRLQVALLVSTHDDGIAARFPELWRISAGRPSISAGGMS